VEFSASAELHKSKQSRGALVRWANMLIESLKVMYPRLNAKQV